MAPLEFQLTRSEYAEFCRILTRLRRDPARVERTVGVAAVAVGILLLGKTDTPLGWLASAMLTALGLFNILYPMLALWRASDRVWQEYEQCPSLIRVTFDGESIRVDTRDMQVEYRRSAFNRFVESPNLLLLIGPSSSPLVIPQRAFADPAELAACIELLKERYRHLTGAFPVIEKDNGAG